MRLSSLFKRNELRWLLGLLWLLIAACQPPAPEGELPTLAVLPSLTSTPAPTETATGTDTPVPSSTPYPTDTPTATPTITSTLEPTRTPRPSATPSITIEPTIAAVASATAAIQERPRFSTFTPAPPGSTPLPQDTPQMLADVVITEQQFQEEVNRRLPDLPSVNRAVVNFVPGGINTEVTALGGEAYITGNVLMTIQLTGGFATIAVSSVQVNAPEPPEAYMKTVSSDFFLMMVDVLDSILKQRLGPEQKLRNIVVTDSAIEATLLVPQS